MANVKVVQYVLRVSSSQLKSRFAINISNINLTMESLNVWSFGTFELFSLLALSYLQDFFVKICLSATQLCWKCDLDRVVSSYAVFPLWALLLCKRIKQKQQEGQSERSEWKAVYYHQVNHLKRSIPGCLISFSFNWLDNGAPACVWRRLTPQSRRCV